MNKTPAAILTDAALAGGASTALADCTIIDASRLVLLTLRVELTFGASADDGATVDLYGAVENDDLEYDTTAWKTWTIALDAGSTVKLHWPDDDEIKPLPKYLKVVVTNNSSGGAGTDITDLVVTEIGLEL